MRIANRGFSTVCVGLALLLAAGTCRADESAADNESSCPTSTKTPRLSWNYLDLLLYQSSDAGDRSGRAIPSGFVWFMGGTNAAWLLDYTHLGAAHLNTDRYETGPVLHTASDTNDQFGIEALISGVRMNPDVGQGTLQNGYALAFTYRHAWDIGRDTPLEFNFRFLHRELTSSSNNAMEGEVAIPIADEWKVTLSGEHSNAPENRYVLGIRRDID